MPHHSIRALAQTSDGYLWVGTLGGLARFDGVRFTSFNSGNTPGLKTSRIVSLYEDREGSLWIGTEHGGLTRYRQGKFTNFSTADGLPSDWVGQVSQDREGNLWAGTQKGVVRLQAGVTTLTTKDDLLHDSVNVVYRDSQGNLWFGTHAGGLTRFRDGKFTSYRLPDAQPGDWVTAIHEGTHGGLWVGTNRGLFNFLNGEVVPSTLPEELSRDLIKCIGQDRVGGLWIGTNTHGLFRLSDGTVTRHPGKEGFGTISAKCLIEDREGNLWVGTATGLLRLSQRKVFSYPEGSELTGLSVVPVTEDLKGTLWIGATCDGLVQLKPVTFQTIPPKGVPLRGCIWSLHAGRDGSLWFGTWGAGLSRLKNGTLTTYTPDNSDLSNDIVLAIYEDREGTLWVGTDRGLNQFRDGRFTAYHTGDGLVHDSVRFITQDPEGALWVGTAGGMSRFKDGRFTNYTTANGLSHNFVQAIREDPDGTLWVGTYGGGLSRFRSGRFVHYTTRYGLFDDFIARILEDDSGNFWMGSNRGIFRVSRRELDDFAEGRARTITSISYGVSDGMPANACNGGGQPAGWKTRDGRLWFPTIKGVVVVDPKAVPSNPTPPPVVIEECLLDRRPVAFPDTLEIGPQGNLEIHYTGLSLIKSEQIRFKYKLAGLDDDWVEAGPRRAAYYSHVPPGKYTFTVIAANSDGVWNTEGKSLRVVVLPPFYRTWWFLTLAALAVAGVVFLGHEYRIRQLKLEQAAQHTFSRQLIASQEAERIHIAREVHDELGQALTALRVDLSWVAEQLPHKDGKLVERIEAMSALTDSTIVTLQKIATELRPGILDNLGLTAAIEWQTEEFSSRTGIRCDLDCLEEIEGSDQVQSTACFRILQETLTNVARHANATEVRISLKKEADRLILQIQDNGRGISESEITDSASIGLLGMKERAQALGGEFDIKGITGKGTSVRVCIPLNETS